MLASPGSQARGSHNPAMYRLDGGHEKSAQRRPGSGRLAAVGTGSAADSVMVRGVIASQTGVRAPKLRKAVRDAKRAGYAYVVLDGQ
jgi:hypothetical protein